MISKINRAGILVTLAFLLSNIALASSASESGQYETKGLYAKPFHERPVKWRFFKQPHLWNHTKPIFFKHLPPYQPPPPPPTPPSPGGGPLFDGVHMFPGNNVWNVPCNNLPVNPNTANYVSHLVGGVHPGFGYMYAGALNGMPVTVVNNAPLVPVTLNEYPAESDPGPYPVPSTGYIIEGAPGPNQPGSGDAHLLVFDTGRQKLYEFYHAAFQNGNWSAGNAAIFDLNSNALRPAGWTSADAAGLPITPGLIRYDEVQSGKIAHALRLCIPWTQEEYIWPARHLTYVTTDPTWPPMGQRFRLKANFDISTFSPINRVILQCLKDYGGFIADNDGPSGSQIFLSGIPDPRWDDNDLHNLVVYVHGTDFEAVDESSLMVDPNSAATNVGSTSSSVASSAPSHHTYSAARAR